MGRESFAQWHLPKNLDGVVLLDDGGPTRFRPQERHFHDELELHLILRGRALFLLEDRRVWAREHTLLWIPPGRDHHLLESSPDFQRWLFLVRRRAVRRVLPVEASSRLLGSRGSDWLGVLAPADARALNTTYAEVREQSGVAVPLMNAGIAYALSRSYLLFQAAGPSPEASTFHVAVADALQALRETVPPPSLAELAERCRLSESHLSKLFTVQVGLSVTEYRNRLRLERFLEMYEMGTERNIMGAALEAGFGSYPQFHRVFRRVMGYSPGRHRHRSA